MSFDTYPSRTEVIGWNPARLAEYMRRMNVSGCDQVILKCNINGQRFLNLSDNDIQKFPKTHAPLVIKISREINKKEEKRGFFSKKSVTPKYQDPEFVPEEQGWDSEEFDQSDDDYESPDADDGEASGGDYESPTEGPPGGGEFDNDYEPPPSEPPEETSRQIFPAKPMGDSDYIDNNRSRGVSMRTPHNMPPTPPQRPGSGPPLPTSNRPSHGGPPPPRREQSPPKSQVLPPNMPPRIDRRTKPSTVERGPPLPGGDVEREGTFPGRKPGGIGDRSTTPRRPLPGDKPQDLARIPKPPIPGGAGVTRSSSSVSHLPPRLCPPVPRNETKDDAHLPKGNAAFNSNTFPLHSRGNIPQPGPPLPPSHAGSLPPSVPLGGSLPSRLHAALNNNRASSRMPGDRYTAAPQLPPVAPTPDPEGEQALNPQWYAGQVTRGQAENLLRSINEDGTFLVRDSSKGSTTQPFTLMVLYQGKVYNIQIRYNEESDVYTLGTGLKSREHFPRVTDIIQFHKQTPLLLIDAKEKGSGQQKQCSLKHPAGY